MVPCKPHPLLFLLISLLSASCVECCKYVVVCSLSLSSSLSLSLSSSPQHHCRNCGKSACTQCSTKRIPLPEFGIKQPTRVCDICYKAVAPDSASSSSTSDPKTKSEGASGASGGNLPEEYLRSSLAKETQVPAAPSDNMKMKEEDDLQLAIAMSLNEQDNKVYLSLPISLTLACLPL